MKGKPFDLLTTIGAKTGKIRRTPLMRVEHDGQYAIVASLGGAPKNPVWYYNVKAHPQGRAAGRLVTKDYEAREVSATRRSLVDRAVEAWPDYADYQTKTDRQIPLFVLPRLTENRWLVALLSVSAELSQSPLDVAAVRGRHRRGRSANFRAWCGRSPLQFSERLSEVTGATVYLKREDLQAVRSYKLRGAHNLLMQLSDDEIAAGRGVLVGGQPRAGLSRWRAARWASMAGCTCPPRRRSRSATASATTDATSSS
jgi:deazaflavin-dependent oxidoreductase (nitroreductase family)